MAVVSVMPVSLVPGTPRCPRASGRGGRDNARPPGSAVPGRRDVGAGSCVHVDAADGAGVRGVRVRLGPGRGRDRGRFTARTRSGHLLVQVPGHEHRDRPVGGSVRTADRQGPAGQPDRLAVPRRRGRPSAHSGDGAAHHLRGRQLLAGAVDAAARDDLPVLLVLGGVLLLPAHPAAVPDRRTGRAAVAGAVLAHGRQRRLGEPVRRADPGPGSIIVPRRAVVAGDRGGGVGRELR